MPIGIYKVNKERESCWICLKQLTLRQQKFCSEKCGHVYNGRIKNKKLLEVRAIDRQTKLRSLFKKSDRPKILDKIPSLPKAGKGKNFKLKKVTVSKSNNLPRKRYAVNRSKQGRSDKTESEMWKWFWDVKFKIEPLEKNT